MTKTLFIGLDGATFTLFDAFTRDRPGEGVVMPTLARLMRDGFQAPLRSTKNPLTPPAWATMMTGRSPGHHGIFDFVKVEDRGRDCLWTLTSASDNRCETIWSIVSRQGKRVVSLNFPMTSPPETVNGSLVSGFVSWKHLRRNMTPPELFDRLKTIPGFDAKELAWDFKREDQIGDDMSYGDLVQWVHAHRLREEQWFKVAETMLTEDRPDLFAVMFDGTDKLQHQLWHVLEPALQPDTPTKEHAHLRELMLGFYRRLDEYIARLIEIAGPDAQVFIASDHGFAGTAQVVRINRYLGELGYLAWAKDDGSAETKRRVEVNFAFLDWEKTTAFCATPSSNGIRIRVAHEPGQPGIAPHEYEGFRERLIADLLALRGPEGEQIITNVMRREDAFPGAAMVDAPDLTLVLNDFGFVSVRDKTPVVAARAYPAGTHHPDGILIAAGPGIARDSSRKLVQLIDVPSMLLHSLDLPVPADFEGEVPRHLLTEAEWTRHPLCAGEAAHAVDRDASADDGPSDAEREKILEQMRALGYLEA